ncbi:MAG: NTP transferase domain-containing protein [Oligoflexales bacterium]|nr:NTP transferase domain-containing protein [Oligoflexales bacterium]
MEQRAKMKDSPNSLAAVILAAGRGSRMKSSIPKVLHPLKGKTLLEWVLTALDEAGVAELCAVLPAEHSEFEDVLAKQPDLSICIQTSTNGTAGAVASSYAFFGEKAPPYAQFSHLLRGRQSQASHVLICNGDTPALKGAVLREFMDFCLQEKASLGVLAMDIPKPQGYGRLVFSPDGRNLLRIVEEKDADEQTRAVRICNSGVIFAKTAYLFDILSRVTNQNQQREYYLTDCVSLAVEDARLKGEVKVVAFVSQDWRSFSGVNDPEQLKQVAELIS